MIVPLAVNGFVTIETRNGESKRIRVRRAHMEEDTGKLTHTMGGSLVDYNRAGVPLLEIVSEPDMNDVHEVEAYSRKLRAILRYLGVNSGDMSKGILRFEANVSVMRQGESQLRERTEIKNLNRHPQYDARAIDYEVARQIKLYESGDAVKPATLGWDENTGRITVQRYKERADEYRYFPEPDLPIVEVSRDWTREIASKLPALPDELEARFVAELGLNAKEARLIAGERAIADYFMAMIDAGSDAKAAYNWITSELFRLMNANDIDREAIGEIPVAAKAYADLLSLVADGVINQNTARKTVLPEMWRGGKTAKAIVAEQNLGAGSRTRTPSRPPWIRSWRTTMTWCSVCFRGNKKVMNALFGKIMGERSAARPIRASCAKPWRRGWDALG